MRQDATIKNRKKLAWRSSRVIRKKCNQGCKIDKDNHLENTIMRMNVNIGLLINHEQINSSRKQKDEKKFKTIVVLKNILRPLEFCVNEIIENH